MMPNYRAPDGIQFSHFKNNKGAKVRFAHAPSQGPTRGRVVILTGFKESIEKYAELARDFQSRGLDVWMMDWRGQGGSERYLPNEPHKAHHEGYDEQIASLHQFTQKILPQDDQKVVMVAHSMGAHIGMRHMKEHPGVFDSAVLTAPMFDIKTDPMPNALARMSAKFAKAGGTLEKYVPGGSDWTHDRQQFMSNRVTSDPERYKAWVDICRTHPEIVLGDPTYGWIYHTFKSIDVLKDDNYLKGIQTPILMQTSGDDQVVSLDAQVQALKSLPHAEHLHITDAKHEIIHERDELRDIWLKRVDDFLNQRLGAHMTPSKKSDHKKIPPRLSA